MFRWRLAGVALLVLGAAVPAKAAEAGDYGAVLGQVYSAYLRVWALREACDQVFPQRIELNRKAFADWKTRYTPLLDELDRRLTGLVRGSSRDQAEFTRNIGRFEGALLEERSSYRGQFVSAPRPDLEKLCGDYPAYLASADADFNVEYAEELREIRKRQLPQ